MSKRLIIILIILFVVTFQIFSTSLIGGLVGLGFDLATTKRVTNFIIEGESVQIGGLSIKNLKKNLSKFDFSVLEFEGRFDIYQQSKLSIAWPMFKNLLLGFGGGSKSQGDLGGKLVGLLSDWSSFSVMAIGIILYATDIFVTGSLVGLFGGEYNINDPSNELQRYAKGFLTAGLITFGAGRLAQFFIPLGYGLRYNKALRFSLGLNKDETDAFGPTLAFSPALVVNKDANLALNLTARVSF